MNKYFYHGGVEGGYESLSATTSGIVKADSPEEGLIAAEQEIKKYAKELGWKRCPVMVVSFSLVG